MPKHVHVTYCTHHIQQSYFSKTIKQEAKYEVQKGKSECAKSNNSGLSLDPVSPLLPAMLCHLVLQITQKNDLCFLHKLPLLMRIPERKLCLQRLIKISVWACLDHCWFKPSYSFSWDNCESCKDSSLAHLWVRPNILINKVWNTLECTHLAKPYCLPAQGLGILSASEANSWHSSSLTTLYICNTPVYFKTASIFKLFPCWNMEHGAT